MSTVIEFTLIIVIVSPTGALNHENILLAWYWFAYWCFAISYTAKHMPWGAPKGQYLHRTMYLCWIKTRTQVGLRLCVLYWCLHFLHFQLYKGMWRCLHIYCSNSLTKHHAIIKINIWLSRTFGLISFCDFTGTHGEHFAEHLHKFFSHYEPIICCICVNSI